MYLGSNEKIKEKVREYNQHSDGFIFNLRDLEMDLERVDKGWYNITSLELRNTLQKVVAQRIGNRDNISVPTAIKLNFADFLSPFNRYFYTHWVRIEKEKLCEIAQNSIVGRRSNRLFYGSEKGGVIYLDSFFPSLDKASIEKEKEEKEKYFKKHYEKIRSSHQEINEEIKKLKIDSEELEGIQFILPTYCECEVATPDYLDHMLNCLPKEEKLVAFKNEMLELIRTNKARIDRIKQESITKIENLMKEKGLREEQFTSYLSGRSKLWREEIKNAYNRKEIEVEEKYFLELVERASEYQKKFEETHKKWEEERNKSEERRKESEEEFRKYQEKVRESDRKYKEREEERNKEREKKRKKREASIKKEEEKRQNREKGFEKEQEEIDHKAEKLRNKINEDLKREEENPSSRNDNYQPKNPVYLSPLTDKTDNYPTRKGNKNNPSPIVDKSKEELSSMIEQLKKEIKELKETIDPTNSAQKLLLSQKEEELHKLEAQFNKIDATKTQVWINPFDKLFIVGGIIIITFCFSVLLIRKRKRLKKR